MHIYNKYQWFHMTSCFHYIHPHNCCLTHPSLLTFPNLPVFSNGTLILYGFCSCMPFFTYHGKHTIILFVCLLSLRDIPEPSIFLKMTWLCSSLWLNNSASYTHVFKYEYIHIVYMTYFVNYLHAYWDLGWFHSLAITRRVK